MKVKVIDRDKEPLAEGWNGQGSNRTYMLDRSILNATTEDIEEVIVDLNSLLIRDRHNIDGHHLVVMRVYVQLSKEGKKRIAERYADPERRACTHIEPLPILSTDEEE